MEGFPSPDEFLAGVERMVSPNQEEIQAISSLIAGLISQNTPAVLNLCAECLRMQHATDMQVAGVLIIIRNILRDDKRNLRKHWKSEVFSELTKKVKDSCREILDSENESNRNLAAALLYKIYEIEDEKWKDCLTEFKTIILSGDFSIWRRVASLEFYKEVSDGNMYKNKELPAECGEVLGFIVRSCVGDPMCPEPVCWVAIRVLESFAEKHPRVFTSAEQVIETIIALNHRIDKLPRDTSVQMIYAIMLDIIFGLYEVADTFMANVYQVVMERFDTCTMGVLTFWIDFIDRERKVMKLRIERGERTICFHKNLNQEFLKMVLGKIAMFSQETIESGIYGYEQEIDMENSINGLATRLARKFVKSIPESAAMVSEFIKAMQDQHSVPGDVAALCGYYVISSGSDPNCIGFLGESFPYLHRMCVCMYPSPVHLAFHVLKKMYASSAQYFDNDAYWECIRNAFTETLDRPAEILSTAVDIMSKIIRGLPERQLLERKDVILDICHKWMDSPTLRASDFVRKPYDVVGQLFTSLMNKMSPEDFKKSMLEMTVGYLKGMIGQSQAVFEAAEICIRQLQSGYLYLVSSLIRVLKSNVYDGVPVIIDILMKILTTHDMGDIHSDAIECLAILYSKCPSATLYQSSGVLDVLNRLFSEGTPDIMGQISNALAYFFKGKIAQHETHSAATLLPGIASSIFDLVCDHSVIPLMKYYYQTLYSLSIIYDCMFEHFPPEYVERLYDTARWVLSGISATPQMLNDYESYEQLFETLAYLFRVLVDPGNKSNKSKEKQKYESHISKEILKNLTKNCISLFTQVSKYLELRDNENIRDVSNIGVMLLHLTMLLRALALNEHSRVICVSLNGGAVKKFMKQLDQFNDDKCTLFRDGSFKEVPQFRANVGWLKENLSKL